MEPEATIKLDEKQLKRVVSLFRSVSRPKEIDFIILGKLFTAKADLGLAAPDSED